MRQVSFSDRPRRRPNITIQQFQFHSTHPSGPRDQPPAVADASPARAWLSVPPPPPASPCIIHSFTLQKFGIQLFRKGAPPSPYNPLHPSSLKIQLTARRAAAAGQRCRSSRRRRRWGGPSAWCPSPRARTPSGNRREKTYVHVVVGVRGQGSDESSVRYELETHHPCPFFCKLPTCPVAACLTSFHPSGSPFPSSFFVVVAAAAASEAGGAAAAASVSSAVGRSQRVSPVDVFLHLRDDGWMERERLACQH